MLCFLAALVRCCVAVFVCVCVCAYVHMMHVSVHSVVCVCGGCLACSCAACARVTTCPKPSQTCTASHSSGHSCRGSQSWHQQLLLPADINGHGVKCESSKRASSSCAVRFICDAPAPEALPGIHRRLCIHMRQTQECQTSLLPCACTTTQSQARTEQAQLLTQSQQ